MHDYEQISHLREMPLHHRDSLKSRTAVRAQEKVNPWSLLWQGLVVSSRLNFDDLSAFHLRASLHLHQRMKVRKMRLSEYLFSDVDGNGALDIVTLSEADAGAKKVRHVLGVYDLDENLNPILRYERELSTSSPLDSTYTQHIEGRDSGFQFCENWLITGQHINECHDVLMSSNWEPGVLSYSIENADPDSFSWQYNEFRFQSGVASRGYRRLPEGAYMPPLNRKNDYQIILAERDESLMPVPNRGNTEKSAFSINGSAHDPMKYDVRWNDFGVYFSVVLADSDLVMPDTCSQQMALQRADHVEFWFDLAPGLMMTEQNRESWMLEYEKNYQNEPYRHDLDEGIYGFAVTADGCVVEMTPVNDSRRAGIRASAEKIANGYRLDVFVPASVLGVETLGNMDRSMGIGFTAKQHDLHESGMFDALATSTWQWPDPFSFGQLWFVGNSISRLPPFPMQWNVWLAGE